MSLICEVAAPFVANAAVEDTDVSRLFLSHAARCLKCQARRASMARTARELTSMADERVEPPADLEWRVMSSLEGDLAVSGVWNRPIGWLTAGLSMAVALLIWRLRPRPS